MSEHNYRGTLYLDMDGVMIHKQHDKANLETHPDGYVPVLLENRGYEYYYPDVVKRLGELGLKVFSSSGRQTSILMGYQDLRGPLGLRDSLVLTELYIDVWTEETIAIKAKAVLNHWLGRMRPHDIISTQTWTTAMGPKNGQPAGDRAIWVDDHIRTLPVFGQVPLRELVTHPEILAVSPDHRFGLTNQDLDRIENFLSQPIAKTD